MGGGITSAVKPQMVVLRGRATPRAPYCRVGAPRRRGTRSSWALRNGGRGRPSPGGLRAPAHPVPQSATGPSPAVAPGPLLRVIPKTAVERGWAAGDRGLRCGHSDTVIIHKEKGMCRTSLSAPLDAPTVHAYPPLPPLHRGTGDCCGGRRNGPSNIQRKTMRIWGTVLKASHGWPTRHCTGHRLCGPVRVPPHAPQTKISQTYCFT